MSSVKTPNYVLKEEFRVTKGIFNEIVLTAGSFVKPIDPIYLPTHIKESVDFKWFQPDQEAFVYCHYGIVLVPKNLIREV